VPKNWASTSRLDATAAAKRRARPASSRAGCAVDKGPAPGAGTAEGESGAGAGAGTGAGSAPSARSSSFVPSGRTPPIAGGGQVGVEVGEDHAEPPGGVGWRRPPRRQAMLLLRVHQALLLSSVVGGSTTPIAAGAMVGGGGGGGLFAPLTPAPRYWHK